MNLCEMCTKVFVKKAYLSTPVNDKRANLARKIFL